MPSNPINNLTLFTSLHGTSLHGTQTVPVSRKLESATLVGNSGSALGEPALHTVSASTFVKDPHAYL